MSKNTAPFTSQYWKDELTRISAWAAMGDNEDYTQVREEAFRHYRHFSGKEDLESGYVAAGQRAENDIARARAAFNTVKNPTKADTTKYDSAVATARETRDTFQKGLRPERFEDGWKSSPYYFDTETDEQYLDGVRRAGDRLTKLRARGRAGCAVSSGTPTSTPGSSIPESQAGTQPDSGGEWTLSTGNTKKADLRPARSGKSTRGGTQYSKCGNSRK